MGGKPRMRTFYHMQEALEDALGDSDAEYAFRLEFGRGYSWSCDLRITPKPNDHDHADRSFVSYVVGAADPEDAALEAVEDALTWLKERQQDNADASAE